MTAFVRLEAIAAPLPLANVDTDKILPARYLTTISRDGLGRALFTTLRDDPDFVLNHAPWDGAQILIARENFGCGSSREHAPWALFDFGIRCVIAPSIADIFYGNCFKNGILPIVLAQPEVEILMTLVSNPATARLTVDLPEQSICVLGGRVFRFAIDPARKADLLAGVDEIARSQGHLKEIAVFEEMRRAGQPWFPDVCQAAIDAASD